LSRRSGVSTIEVQYLEVAFSIGDEVKDAVRLFFINIVVLERGAIRRDRNEIGIELFEFQIDRDRLAGGATR